MNQQTASQPGLMTQNAYDVKDLNLWYGDHHALKDVSLEIQEKPGDLDHRPIRLWQIDLCQNTQPNGRRGSRRPDNR